MKKGNKTFKELLLELELEQGRSCWIFLLMGKFSPNIAMIMINPTPPFSQLVLPPNFAWRSAGATLLVVTSRARGFKTITKPLKQSNSIQFQGD